MSRYYEMLVEISEYDPKRVTEIEVAAGDVWSFDDWLKVTQLGIRVLSALGRDNLTGGTTEEDFSKELIRAIWQANKVYCKVEVYCTCLEDLPRNMYTLDESKYEYIPLEDDDEEDYSASEG